MPSRQQSNPENRAVNLFAVPNTRTSPAVADFYQQVRSRSDMFTSPLTAEDMQVQSMPDASPTKWHLGHTTWFFETFILQHYLTAYQPYDSQFNFLFNSYYESVGERHARPQRGFLTRPSFNEVMDYREYVDEQVMKLLEMGDPDIEFLVTVGLHHEMQHQELMHTDLLHLLSHNPMHPIAFQGNRGNPTELSPLKMIKFNGGLYEFGANPEEQDFHYDCEGPRHKGYLPDFALSNRLITNQDWLEFMDDSGYQQSLLWLSDGWNHCQQERWEMPLYWQKQDGEYFQFGLDGLRPVELEAPVCHVSFYEADAYARWAGKRLPREYEIELAGAGKPIDGNFLEQQFYRPQAARDTQSPVTQLFGDVWEWTQSPFIAYPGFEPALGALGEYNGKFMANQYVLRGGSCVTPLAQLRNTYRNFFYPHHRWQYSGFRLAEEL